jgi:hypothetical protein
MERPRREHVDERALPRVLQPDQRQLHLPVEEQAGGGGRVAQGRGRGGAWAQGAQPRQCAPSAHQRCSGGGDANAHATRVQAPRRAAAPARPAAAHARLRSPHLRSHSSMPWNHDEMAYIAGGLLRSGPPARLRRSRWSAEPPCARSGGAAAAGCPGAGAWGGVGLWVSRGAGGANMGMVDLMCAARGRDRPQAVRRARGRRLGRQRGGAQPRGRAPHGRAGAPPGRPCPPAWTSGSHGAPRPARQTSTAERSHNFDPLTDWG